MSRDNRSSEPQPFPVDFGVWYSAEYLHEIAAEEGILLRLDQISAMQFANEVPRELLAAGLLMLVNAPA